MRRELFLIVLLYVFCFAIIGGDAVKIEKKIWNSLAGAREDNKFIPLQGNQSVEVKIEVTLITMSDYDHMTGTIHLGYWLDIVWTPPQMSWDPKKFQGVKQIHVPVSEVWVPDIVPYKHTDNNIAHEGRVLIIDNGEHMWIPHIMTTIICKDIVNGPRFPRDRKLCKMKLGSWVYNGHQLDLKLLKKDSPKKLTADLDSTPLQSSGWKFINASVKRLSTTYSCCPEQFHSVEVDIIIQRRDIYFGLAVTAPGVVTGLLLSLLYLVAPCSPARIVAQSVCLLILIFVAVTDLRLMGSSVVKAPAAIYFVAAMVLNLFALLWSIVVSIVWAQAPPRSRNVQGVLDSVLDRLECICLLPSSSVEAESQVLNLDGDDQPKRPPAGLSTRQRLCLVLDRLLALVNMILFIILFAYLGV